jgi:hypothetical protein
MTTNIALNSVWTPFPDAPSFGLCAYAVVIAIGTTYVHYRRFTPNGKAVDRNFLTTPISWFITKYQLDLKSDSEYIL